MAYFGEFGPYVLWEKRARVVASVCEVKGKGRAERTGEGKEREGVRRVEKDWSERERLASV